MRRARRGFALMAVLWVLAISASVGLLLVRSARDAVGAARNRVSLTRATWVAEGCAERARAVIDITLHDEVRANVWRTLDASLQQAQSADCAVSLTPDDVRLDINTISDETLRALAREVSVSSTGADSLVSARADWIDADDITRAFGAERSWYRAAGLVEPRNGPLASIDELKLVRGFAAVPQLDSVLAVAPARIWLERAPAAVLAALPGFTPEAVATMLTLRAVSSDTPVDVATLGAHLSPEARLVLVSRTQELSSLVTNEPDAWVLTARATSGQPAIESIYEIRLVRSGKRAAIVRRRQWP